MAAPSRVCAGSAPPVSLIPSMGAQAYRQIGILPINLDALAERVAEEIRTEGNEPYEVVPVDNTHLAESD